MKRIGTVACQGGNGVLKTNVRLITTAGLMILAVLGTITAIASAQTTTITSDVSRPVQGVGHNYISSFAETVNPANGSLSISLPLPTPKSRVFTLPLSLMYNSGQVNHFQSAAPGEGELIPDSLSSVSSGGWSDTLPYATSSDWTQALPSSLVRGNWDCEYTSSYVFYDASGGSHSLGLAGVSYLQSQGGGGDPATGVCPELNSPAEFSAITYGSDTKVEANALANCNGVPGSGSTATSCNYGAFSFTVSELDGTVYTFPWVEGGPTAFTASSTTGPVSTFTKTDFYFPSTIEDRNGNIMKVSLTPTEPGNALPTTETITDTAGRPAIVVERPSGGIIPSSYTVGGETYTITPISVPTNYTLTPTPIGSTANLTNGEYCNPELSVPNTSVGTGNPIVPNPGNPMAISLITLPNGQSFQFYYGENNPNDSSIYNPYGLINEIIYPDGGWVKYTWKLNDTNSDMIAFNGGTLINDQPTPDPGGCTYEYQTPVVATRQVGFSKASTTPALTQAFTYSTTWSSSIYGWTGKQTTVTTTDNVTGNKSQVIYKYGSVEVLPDADAPSVPPGQIPVENSVQYTDLGTATAPLNALLKTEYKAWLNQFFPDGENVQLSNGHGSQTVNCYLNFPGQPLGALNGFAVLQEKDEYNSAASPSAPPVWNSGGCSTTSAPRSTTYAYAAFGEPNQIVIYASGTRIAETDVAYDGATLASASVPPGTYDSTYNTSTPSVRGNATKVTKWANTGSSDIKTYMYDMTGQMLSMTDGCGNSSCADMATETSHKTMYSYGDNYTQLSGGSNVTYTPGATTDAYLTKITDPLGGTAEFSYDYISGQVTSATDPNNQTTRFVYADPLNRPTAALFPDGGQTLTSYQDSVPSVTTTQLLNSDGLEKQTITMMDGLGHVKQTELASDPDGPIYVQTTPTGLGQVYKVTNPFRSTSDTTYGTTTYVYDALGQKIQATNPDGSVVSWCYNGVPSSVHSTCPGLLASSYPSSDIPFSWIDSYDELGNHHQHASDAFGRLFAVMEPNGVSAAPSMETDYTYNLLDDLVGVTQNGTTGSGTARTRGFTYDSLSRLLTSANPETGTITYTYDANSNLSSKTDARGITTSYGYDSLNHLLSKGYLSDSTGTTWSCYQYGTSTIGNTNERLINEWTQSASVGSCVASAPTTGFWTKRSISAYDPMGRLLNEQQFTPSNLTSATAYAPAYTYDLAGNVLTSNPGLPASPAVVGAPANPMHFTYGYDAANRLSSVTSSLTEAISSNYPTTLFQAQSTSPAAYGPMGLTYATLGVNANTSVPALTQTRTYDQRSRVLSELDEATAAQATAGTGSAGSVAAAGTEQSYNSGNTHATGTISINSMPAGPESGTVTVTIAGQACATSWSESPNGSQPSALATSIASTINGQLSFYVTAVASGSSILLTSKATGTTANYSVSVSQTVTNNKPVSVSSPSALTGGAAGPPSDIVYDTGTVSLTIGSQVMNVSYGQTDTSATIASKLQSAINTSFGSLIQVTPSGSSLSLVSGGVGSNFNYAVSGSVTSNNSNFTSPSFSLSTVSMTGGSNPTYQQAAEYQYSLGYDTDSDLTSANDTVTGNWTYGYDSLNRLVTGTASSGSYNGQHGCWAYDGFGNRTAETYQATACATPETSVTPTTNYNASNYVTGTTVNSATNGFVYDASGDVTNDNLNSYAYDAEGRLCAVSSRLGGSPVGYIYDASGTRVAKGTVTILGCNPATNGFTVTNSYVLGLGGEQFSEVTVSGSTDTWAHTNVFAGGRLMATYNGSNTYFALSDWLGTKRVEYMPNGQSASFFSLPYGNGLSPSGTAIDATENHFTGKERDAESGLDYFGARYYASNMGRWMSPDWAKTPEGVPYADLSNPQSLNLYGYLSNNPLSHTDPDGHQCDWCNTVMSWLSSSHSSSASASVTGGQGSASNGPISADAKALTASASANASYGSNTSAGAKASASFAEATVNEGTHSTTQMDGLTANASANAGVQLGGGNGVGIKAAAGANADVLTASQTEKINIGPITITGTATGAVGVGANASASLGTNGVSASAGVTPGVGGSVSLSITWGSVSAQGGASSNTNLNSTTNKVNQPVIKQQP